MRNKAILCLAALLLVGAARGGAQDIFPAGNAKPTVTYTSGDYQIIGFRGIDTASFAVSNDAMVLSTGMKFRSWDDQLMSIQRVGNELWFNTTDRSIFQTYMTLEPYSTGVTMTLYGNDGNKDNVKIDADNDSPTLYMNGTYRGGRIYLTATDPTADSDLMAEHPFAIYSGRSGSETEVKMGAVDTYLKSRFIVWKGYGTGKVFSIDSSGNVTIAYANNHLSKRKHLLNVAGTGLFDSSVIALGDVSGATFNGVKVYRAFLTQTGTSAPTATILENSLGTIVWARADTGTYTATLSNAFTANKTWAENKIISASTGAVYDIVRTSASVMTVTTRQMPGAAARKDALLSSTVLEIRVYP
ncbi:MAG TPA: hypothetical protein PK916_08815 [Bacteroidota bacterium]|nr:hypothetical protein [Bacteroidota bacterium]